MAEEVFQNLHMNRSTTVQVDLPYRNTRLQYKTPAPAAHTRKHASSEWPE